MSQRVAFIGLRATGKTTIGRALAARLGWPFADVDDVIETIAGKTIARIFAEDGEPRFRDLEAEAIRSLCEREPIVIATGGGAVLRAETRERLSTHCHVIWLTATVETMLARLSADATTTNRRPNLTGLSPRDEIVRLCGEREPLYREIAHHIVATDDDPADKISDSLLTDGR